MMTVEGLKPGTTYVFRVRARTDGGYGSYGGEIELETSHEGTVKQGIIDFLFTYRESDISVFLPAVLSHFVQLICFFFISFPPTKFPCGQLKIGIAASPCLIHACSSNAVCILNIRNLKVLVKKKKTGQRLPLEQNVHLYYIKCTKI